MSVISALAQQNSIELYANHPLNLNKHDEIWLILEGGIDIFSVYSTEKKVVDSRQHLCRITKDNLFLGMRFEQQPLEVTLVAVPLPNTRVLCFTRDQFSQLLKKSEYCDFFIPYLEKWVNQLPLKLLPLETYTDRIDQIAIDAPACFLSSQKIHHSQSTIWVQIKQGKASWLAMPLSTETTLQNYFPLSASLWLEVETHSEVNIIDTKQCIHQEKLFSSLDQLYRIIFNYFIKQKNTQAAILTADINRKEQQKEKLFSHLMQDFKLLAKPNTSLVESWQQYSDDVLFDVCQLVAKASNIELILPEIKQDDTSISDKLELLIEANCLNSRTISLKTSQWWCSSGMPLLAFTRENKTPIALIPTERNKYLWLESNHQPQQVVTAALAEKLDDQAVMFCRGFPAMPISIKNLLQFSFEGNKKDFLRILITGMLGGLVTLAIPIASKIIFNTFIPNAESQSLWQIMMIIILVTLAGGVFDIVRSIALLRIDGRMNLNTTTAIIMRLFSLPAPFFRQFSAGDLAQRAFGISQILQILTGTTQNAVLAGIFSIFSLIYMFIINIPLATIGAGLLLIWLTIFTLFNLKRLSHMQQFTALQGTTISKAYQFLTAINKLRTTGAEIAAHVLWGNEFLRKTKATYNEQIIANQLNIVSATFSIFALIAIFSSIVFIHIKISTGDFLAFIAAFTQLSLAILTMSDACTQSLNIIPLYQRAAPILQSLPEVDINKIKLTKLNGRIEASHLYFRYFPTGPWILEDISFQINPREFVAFVGVSGSGKSTLLRLLLGLEIAENGSIYIDGKDLTQINLPLFRRKIGVVTQNSKLTPGNLFENIVGVSQATVEDAWEAARLAGIADDIAKMPMGMNTLLSEDSTVLSGGQRQRILIARAIVNKPKILLLDEASSAMDNITQAWVTKSLNNLQATRIVIAQRLSTIIQANRIYVMQEGKIVEQGNYNELMAMNGVFKEIAQRQLT